MEGSFLYRPLDLDPQSRQLRFLHLLPAQRFDDDIHCTIFHGSLQDRPSYEALSYVWGSEEHKPSIHLSYVPEQIEGASEAQDEENPKLTSKKSVPIQVTQNLFVALRHIRLPDVSRTMWIDAICINQSLTDEKAHQVKQMRQVYLLSQRVVLWLGEEENSSIAINFLRDMPLQQNGDAAYSWNKNDITKWTACDDLFLKRPYWGRSWILQEVLHDKDVIVYIGLQTLTIEELFALFKKYFTLRRAITTIALNALNEEGQPSNNTEEHKRALANDRWFRAAATVESMPGTLVDMRLSFKKDAKFEPRLPMLLYTFRDQQAGLAKDKMYSLQGMAKQEYIIDIDYSEDESEERPNLTKRGLYILITRQLLARVLVVLLWIEAPKREIENGMDEPKLPSWVPDFTQEQQLSAKFLYTSSSCFSADKNFPGGMVTVPAQSMETLKRNGVFTIRGVCVGRITSTHVVNLTKQWSEDPKWKDWDRVKLFWYELGSYSDHKESAMISTAEPAPESRIPTPTFENTNWGPCKAEAGDIIVVVAGSKIPLVLRKEVDRFLFVGGCLLVDSRIDVTKLTLGCGEQEGFSKIMYGSVVEEIGKTCKVEEFEMC
jgi:hypothetical protein